MFNFFLNYFISYLRGKYFILFSFLLNVGAIYVPHFTWLYFITYSNAITLKCLLFYASNEHLTLIIIIVIIILKTKSLSLIKKKMFPAITNGYISNAKSSSLKHLFNSQSKAKSPSWNCVKYSFPNFIHLQIRSISQYCSLNLWFLLFEPYMSITNWFPYWNPICSINL